MSDRIQRNDPTDALADSLSIDMARDRLRVLEKDIAHRVASLLEQYSVKTGLSPNSVTIHMQDVSGLGDEQRRHVVVACSVEVVL